MTPFSFSRAAPLLAALAVAAVPAAHAQAPAAADIIVSGPAGQVTRAEVEARVEERVPPQQRLMFWSTRDPVTRLARGLYAQKELAREAEQQGLENTPEGAALLRASREAALSELMLRASARAAQPDEAAIEAFARSEYKAHPERFTKGEEIRARHILLPVAADGSDDAQVKARAEELLAQLRQGADFAKLAEEYSSDKGSAARGGDLGFFGKGKMVPPFEEAAFALKQPGDLSAPVKSQFGWHIIELVERKPGAVEPFEQALPELRRELIAKLTSRAQQEAWSRAESAAQVDEAAVQSLVARQLEDLQQNGPQ